MLLFLMHEAIVENSCRVFMGTSVLLEEPAEGNSVCVLYPVCDVQLVSLKVT